MKGFERTPSFLSAAAFVGVALAGLVLMTAAGCAGLPTDALAQTYPAKPVKFVVSSPPPGGPLDIVARAVAERLTQSLKQPFVVENKPGAAGNIGADAGAKSKPDRDTGLCHRKMMRAPE